MVHGETTMVSYKFILQTKSTFGGSYNPRKDEITLYLGKPFNLRKFIKNLTHEHIHQILRGWEDIYSLLQGYRLALEEEYGEDVFFLGGHNPLLGISDPEEEMIKRFLEVI